MPRTARLDIPGQLYHVTARGVERCDIFRDDFDRSAFCDRFSALLLEADSACFAWALMPNHFHLLLRPGPCGLANFMRRLLTGHAVAFNRRHQRTGHLFQNRYHSILCDSDAYLVPLVRYIHLNPLKVGVVDSLEALDTYPWCGHAVLMEKTLLTGQLVDEVLALYAKTEKTARRRYREYIAQGLLEKYQHNEWVDFAQLRYVLKATSNEDPGDTWTLGGQSFVATILSNNAIGHKKGIGFEELTQRVAKEFAVSVEELCSRRRTANLSEARALLCVLAMEGPQITGVQLADFLGQARSSISRAERRGKHLLKKRPNLRDLLKNN